MIAAVKKTNAIYNMFSGGDKVLVGLSGGPDSVCLLYILKGLGLKLYIAHLNHGLRAMESDRDQRFCEELGKRLGIPVYTKKIKVKKSEEACRNARYRFLEETAKRVGAEKIAMGHNADDQAETVLMRLLRGAGVKGLSGIPPVRGLIVRPLINVWRSEILDYLRKRKIPYRIDSTNLKTDFFRNRIRHELIPFLATYNPNIKNILRNTGRNMAVMNQYLEQELVRRTAQGMGLNLSSSHITDIMALAGEKAGSKSICLPKGIKVIKEYDRLFFSKGRFEASDFEKNLMLQGEKEFLKEKRSFSFKPEGASLERKGETAKRHAGETFGFPHEYLELPIPGKVRIPSSNTFITSRLCKKPKKIPRKSFEVMLDYDKISHPLIVRNRMPGDVFQPIGLNGKKTLKDIFIDEKIPKRVRDRIPLVVSGKDICWIPGYRISENFKIGPETKRVVKLWQS